MLRKITSLTSLISFIITLVTSVVLYIVPEGRVAYWADWHFLGLSKTQWGDVHITVGLLFIVALLIHAWLNWKVLVAYMKNQARAMVIMTKPMIISLLISLFVAVGTLLGLPPMQQVIDLTEHIKSGAMETYGNPPYGHAETSPLYKFCGFLGFDVNEALIALKKAGYPDSVTAQTEIREIARSKGVSPQHVFNDIRSALADDPFSAMPETQPDGIGKMKISDLCVIYGLPVDEAIARLEKKGIVASPDMKLKDAGSKNNLSPREIYNALQAE